MPCQAFIERPPSYLGSSSKLPSPMSLSELTGIQSLPVELLRQITSYLKPKDWKALLLTATSFCVIEPLFYEELRLSDTQLERNTLLLAKLSTRPELAVVTRTLNIDLHGCNNQMAWSCWRRTIWKEVYASTGVDASDVFHGSCGCCHIEWRDALLPRVVLCLPNVVSVHFKIYRHPFTFDKDFYRTFHAVRSLTLSSLSLHTPNVKTFPDLSYNQGQTLSLLGSQPTLRHLVMMCHVNPVKFENGELPLLESFAGSLNYWRLLEGRPVRRIRFVCRSDWKHMPGRFLEHVLERLVMLGTGPIREITLVFSDTRIREMAWEESFVTAPLKSVPGLQKMVIESPRCTVEVPITTMDVPAFLLYHGFSR